MPKIGRGHRLQRRNLALLKWLTIPGGVLICRTRLTPAQRANLRATWEKAWQDAPTKITLLRDSDTRVRLSERWLMK